MTIEKIWLLAAAVLPAIVLVRWLTWRLDATRVPAVVLSLLVGALAAAPAVVLERALTLKPWTVSNLGTLFIFTLVVAGVVEETCKLVAFWAGPGRSSAFTEEYDGILFAACVSLGFATVENFAHVLGGGGLQTAWARAFTAVPAHVMFGIVMGSCLGLARVRQRFRWNDAGLVITGVALAAAAHGVYDLLAFLASPLTPYALAIFLVSLGTWCWQRVRLARARSPHAGGIALSVPPPLFTGRLALPPPPLTRNPWVSGALGLLPGMGQAYNGDRAKACVFLGIGAVNLGLYYVAQFFIRQPMEALRMLEGLGMTLVMTRADVAASIEQKWVLLPVLLGLVVLWSLIGAADAAFSARARAFRPQHLSVTRSFAAQGFGCSYALHLVVLFLLVFGPLMLQAVGAGTSTEESAPGSARAAGSGGLPGQDATNGGNLDLGMRGGTLELTWVRAPVRLQGYRLHAEGRRDGRDQESPGEPRIRLRENGPGQAALKVGPTGTSPRGEEGTYNEYLSSQVRQDRNDFHFFRHVPHDVWAVVRYHIAPDGTLVDVTLLESNGTLDQAGRAVEVVRMSAPFHPLPEKVEGVVVTELFWTVRGPRFQPGSMAERLSRLPDGRSLRVIGGAQAATEHATDPEQQAHASR